LKWFLLVILGMLGCGGSSTSGSYAPQQTYYAGAESEILTSDDVDADSVQVQSTSRSTSTQSTNTPRSDQKAEVDLDQKLVKNAYVTLEMDDEDDFEPAIRKMADLAKLHKGYVVDESKTGITFKVPTDKLDPVMVAVRELGEVTQQNITVSDVTGQYVDLQIRIDNLRRLRARLQELLVQGQTVTEVLEVEKELARVTRELEQLEGQMRLLQNQVGYATVRTSLEESVSPGPIGWIFYGTYKAVKWLFIWD
jgi:hypothetical protein